MVSEFFMNNEKASVEQTIWKTLSLLGYGIRYYERPTSKRISFEDQR
jgi:hypothetical protein